MDFMNWLYVTRHMTMYDYWACTAEYRRTLDLEYERGCRMIVRGNS